ncbi:prolyl aminopeptidase [Micromonospora sp. WMMD1128]|uniref:prolyl aminopeptidase n=1 Tax=unclassified Micromonospora TaxID=2617518 RepID=UPI00248BAFA9|nr:MULTISPECIES: prolyl aminopeptidase [unclassified Micromonospora]WBB76493.1 prolyl aminopeptidase [Micromonospora sp. WMMD1128]WFE35723.1 prolyl aminopeptidase [Micromonospora sp. WMMD975]
MYPPIEPYAEGFLDVGDGQRVRWETCGNPDGRPALVVHGGPGSGAGASWRQLFDPAVYRIVLFDQRGCGGSTPSAADPATDLSVNTTAHLLADMEALRAHLGVDRWLLCGASWGSTLSLAYAQAHPQRVTALVLFSVVATTAREVEWVTRDMGRVFPEQWARFRDGVPVADRDGDLAAAYARLVNDPDPVVRDRAARDWCAWEDVHVSLAGGDAPSLRYADPVFRFGFTRLVTHYFAHAGFLPDGQLLRDATRLAGIPGVLVQGRLDVSGPPDIAWELTRRWPDARLEIVEAGGHGSGHGIGERVVAALDALAAA